MVSAYGAILDNFLCHLFVRALGFSKRRETLCNTKQQLVVGDEQVEKNNQCCRSK